MLFFLPRLYLIKSFLLCKFDGKFPARALDPARSFPVPLQGASMSQLKSQPLQDPLRRGSSFWQHQCGWWTPLSPQPR